MSQPESQYTRAPRGVWVALGVVLVLVLAMVGFFLAYSHLPRAGGPNSGTSSDLVTPTAVLTNPVGMLTVNRSIDFDGAHITVMQVQEAGAFSDDQKHAGAYTVRVYLQAKNGGRTAVGINYPSDTRLLLPGGQMAAPLFLAIAPVVLPGQMQVGFLDFPVSNKVDLSSLTLRFGSGAVVAFGG